MTINERIASLRAEMAKRNIDIYIIPTSDFHQTETVGAYFKARKFMSGFTGSDGTLVVTLNEAALWVDGRYFLQAEKELIDTEIIKMEMGESGVPTIFEYIDEKLPKCGIIGFDGRVINGQFAFLLEDIAFEKGGNLYCVEDLVDIIWKDRPALPKEKAWLLEDDFAGETTTEKIEKLQQYLVENDYDMQILSTLDDIAWLTNIRGNDIECFPVMLAYMVVTPSEKYIFADKAKFTDEILENFADNNIEIREYDDIYEFVENIHVERVLADLNTLNYSIYSSIPIEVEVADKISPTQLWKARKSKVEIENIRNAHLKDGIAQTKFIYWLKNNVGKIPMDEVYVAEKLLSFRKEQEFFIEPSFDTIAAYGENGAYVHYHADKGNCASLEPKGFLLVDSGGHYKDGSTDTTRTIALGDVSDKQKRHFTAVLKGMLRLSRAKFLYGCTGINLDILCRGMLWDMGLDYKHGTGHGIGYISAIHEGPNRFGWKKSVNMQDVVIEEGMITSNEPGLYLAEEYGIRIENELLAIRDEKNEYGQFMTFETLTFVPIDLDAIDVSMLDETEKKQLNNYHKEVYDKISPFLSYNECEWLKENTRAI